MYNPWQYTELYNCIAQRSTMYSMNATYSMQCRLQILAYLRVLRTVRAALALFLVRESFLHELPRRLPTQHVTSTCRMRRSKGNRRAKGMRREGLETEA